LEEIISLDLIDSEIIAMYHFDNKLFMGCKNGNLYSYDGATISLVKTFSSQIGRLYSDNSLLYIILRNSKMIQIYDGQTFLEISV